MTKPQGQNERVVQASKLESLLADVFKRAGVPSDEAAIVADALVTADARGMHSHGCMRTSIYLQKIRSGGFKPGHKGKIIRETASTILLDGEDGLGHIIGSRAVDEAIKKARAVGTGVAGVTGSNHFGEGAYFVLRAARQGLIALITSNGSPHMPFWGGTKRLTGPLPLAVAAPAKEEQPVVLDMAMGVTAKGKLLYAAEKGEAIPEGWGVDKDGQATTDPHAVLDGGWLLPIGGYKGSGIIYMLELLSGALTGGAMGQQINNLYGEDLSAPQRLGHFVLAIDPESFLPGEQFGKRVDAWIREVKTSPPARGFDEVLVPGELEFRRERERRREGIPLSVAVIDEIEGLAAELGIPCSLADGGDA